MLLDADLLQAASHENRPPGEGRERNVFIVKPSATFTREQPYDPMRLMNTQPVVCWWFEMLDGRLVVFGVRAGL